VRRATIKVHKYVGLVVAVWVIVQAVTGSLLAFSDQIDAWANPQLFHHSAGDVGPQAASSAGSAAVHGVVTNVQLPANETGVYVVSVALMAGRTAKSTGLPPLRLVYVNPGNGHVNGVRDPSAGFTHWLSRVHGNLLQTTLFGVKGSVIVGWFGVVTILVLLTGAYLWLWPAVRKWSTLFRLRRKSAMVFSLDVHRLAGIVVFPLLLVTLVTGLNLVFAKELRQVWYDVVPGADHGSRTALVPPQSAAAAPGAPAVDLAVVRNAAAHATHGRVNSISVPFKPTGAFTVKVSRGWDPGSGPRGRGGNVVAYVDQHTGSVLRVVTPSHYSVSGQLYEFWAEPVHSGAAGGTATRILVDLIGVGTLAMIGSGIGLTVVRARKRTRRKEALSGALPKLPVPVLEDAVQQSWIETVPSGAVVVRQGEVADAFYVILSGRFEVRDGSGVLRELSEGDSFGQIGLMITGTRTADVVAITPGELVVVPTSEFDLILRRAERDGISMRDAGLEYSAEFLSAR